MNPVNGNLTHLLGINTPGITAIVGSGGKSTLLRALGLELMLSGSRVLLATSTHMFPVAGVPWEGAARRMTGVAWRTAGLHAPGCTCAQCMGPRGSICQAGTVDAQTGKLGAPSEPWGELAARFDHVLVEADGSKRLPLKAHAGWEPVIPEGAARVIWIVGASGLGRPIAEVVHRPELFCEICGCTPADSATPERVAKTLTHEMWELGLGDAAIVLNQVDTLDDIPGTVACFEHILGRPVIPLRLRPR